MSDAFVESNSNVYRNFVTFVTGFGIIADQTFQIGSPTSANSNLVTYNVIQPIGGISGYATSGNLQATGQNLLALINASAAGVSTLNHASGIIDITGKGNVTIISGGVGLIFVSGDTSNLATIDNLYQSGNNLYGYINNWSGIITSNLGQTGISLKNSSNLLSGNLGLTGQTLYGYILSLSGIAQTPWQTNIDGNQKNLTNVSIIRFDTLLHLNNLFGFTPDVNGMDLSFTSSGDINIYPGANYGQTKDFYIYNGADQTTKYFVVKGNSGYVGIGSTSPISKLDVSGDIYAGGGKVLTRLESGILNSNIQNTGINLQNSLNSLSGVLGISGSNLYILINNYTGFANTNPSGFVTINHNHNYVTALNVTGFTNSTGIINFSGLGSVVVSTGIGNFIYFSGSPSSTLDHSDGINISGQLTQTGQTLYNDIIGLSGVLNTDISNLYLTGSALYNDINNFSGVFNNSGTQYQSQINSVTSNLEQTGISLKATDGLISGNLTQTGVSLRNYIDGISKVSALNVTGWGNQTGIINFSGKGSVVVFTGDNNFVYISGSPNASSDHGDGINISGNLTSTGQTLYGYITSLSGAEDTKINDINNLTGSFYPFNNPSNFSSSGNVQSTGQNILSILNTTTGYFNTNPSGYIIGNQTGQFYATSNPTGFITLQVTGMTVSTGKIGLSGAGGIIVSTGSGNFIFISGGNYYPSGQNPSGYIRYIEYPSIVSGINVTGFGTQTGLLNITGVSFIYTLTGSNNRLIISGDSSQIASISNLYSTGSTLYNYIIGLTGVVTGNNINLYTTGSNLYNLINNFSGVFNSSGTQYQNQLNTITLNLTTTGVNLGSKIDSLSGFVKNTSISVTGFSAQTGNINISGLGPITVFTGNNNFIYISGTVGQGDTITNNIYFTGVPSGVSIFRDFIANNVSKQFIPFPQGIIYSGNPIIIATLHNDVDNTVLPCQISGAVSTGFWAILPNNTTNTGYIIDVIATSTGTGLAANIYINSSTTTNNITNNISGSQLQITGSTYLTGINWTGMGGITLLQSGVFGVISGCQEALQATGQNLLTIVQNASGALKRFPMCIPWNQVSVTNTNQTAVTQFFDASNIYVTYVDLSLCTGASLSVSKLGTAAHTSGQIFLGYNTTGFAQNPVDYPNITSDNMGIRTNVTNTIINSGWHPLVAAARAPVYLSLMMTGGNGVLDPVYGMINSFFM